MAVRGPAPCPRWIGRPGLADASVLLDAVGRQGAARANAAAHAEARGYTRGSRATQASQRKSGFAERIGVSPNDAERAERRTCHLISMLVRCVLHLWVVTQILRIIAP